MGCMWDEVCEILSRDNRKLATARDLPRLVQRTRLLSSDAAACPLFEGAKCGGTSTTASGGGGVLEFLSALHRHCGEEGEQEPRPAAEAADTVRAYIATLQRQSVAQFVLHCTNQNVIAPAILRIKHGVMQTRIQTKDGPNWRIVVVLNGDKTTVTHTRDELDVEGRFSFEWELEVSKSHAKLSLLSVESISKSFDVTELRNVLLRVVAKANEKSDGLIHLPSPAEYNAAYFNWK